MQMENVQFKPKKIHKNLIYRVLIHILPCYVSSHNGLNKATSHLTQNKSAAPACTATSHVLLLDADADVSV